MRLLDAAEVRPREGDWHRGWEGDSRVCSGLHVYLSECDPEVTADIIGDPDTFYEDDCGYRVVPFGIVAELDRKTIMSKPDDEEWLKQALRDSAEIPVARGLLVRQSMGITRDGDQVFTDVWVGSDDAEQVDAPSMSDLSSVASAVSEGRRVFFSKTLGIRPILHVNPDNAVALKNAGVLLEPNADNEVRTVWDDPVVISEGYYNIEGMSATPAAFWTGPVQVTLSDINEEEVLRAARMNRERFQVTMLAAIDTAPCAIVRIGAAPAPAG